MSVYHSSFNYLGKNSKNDMGLIVSHLDNSDTGEVETFMSMDPVYTDNYLGSRRIDYGAKYNSVAVFNITVIKQSGGDFSVHEIRECLKWLTGAQSNSNLELVVNNEVKYSFTGRFTNASHYKMDARTIGLILEFTSIAPWAYSAPQVVEQTVTGSEALQINCDTDDLYSHVYMKTTYTNTSGESVVIQNTTVGDSTEISNLVANEVITLDNNMMITSDRSERVFGNDFNFTFPRLQAGLNELTITGNGSVKFEYIVPIKLGNVAMDINTYSDPICEDSGAITIEMLPWSRISETPTTLSGYKIQDAYTKSEVDAKISNVQVSAVSWDNITHKPTTVEGFGLTDVYIKSDIDAMLDNFVDDDVYTKAEIDVMLENFVDDDVYSKAEVDALLSSMEVKIDEDELNTMLEEVLG